MVLAAHWVMCVCAPLKRKKSCHSQRSWGWNLLLIGCVLEYFRSLLCHIPESSPFYQSPPIFILWPLCGWFSNRLYILSCMIWFYFSVVILIIGDNYEDGSIWLHHFFLHLIWLSRGFKLGWLPPEFWLMSKHFVFCANNVFPTSSKGKPSLYRLEDHQR